MKSLFTVGVTTLLLALFASKSHAQTNTFPSTGAAGIGTLTPDASSLLEIKSTAKGILIPRMTGAQRNAIVSPATGLLVYQTNGAAGFFYYSGTAWKAVSPKGVNTSLSNLTPTAINQSLIPGTTNSFDLGSPSILWKNAYFGGDALINGITVGRGGGAQLSNTANGYGALISNLGGSGNTANGAYALYYNDGSYNTACGSQALEYNTVGSGNTATGTQALWVNTGDWNTANGLNALYHNTGGIGNTANGAYALFTNTQGRYNTADGFNALPYNTTGYSNVAIGNNSLYSNTASSNLVAVGDSALYKNTGGHNTAIGSKTLSSNTSGVENTASGFQALQFNQFGARNTANGAQALFFNEGDGNTANGWQALYSSFNGYYNTALGYAADVSMQDLSNATALGANAIVDASNKVRVGDNNVTSIGGKVGWTTFPSDGRYKKNIKEDVQGLAFINSLKPITYTVDIDGLNAYFDKNRKHDDAYEKMKKNMQPAADEASKIVYNGFIAQDVEAAAKKLNYNFSGVDKPKTEDGLYGLRYSDFVVPLVKAVQELSKQNDEQKKINSDLQQQIDELKKMMANNRSSTTVQNVEAGSAGILDQNIPNPFSNSTTIGYYLPKNNGNAFINFYAQDGSVVKSVKLTANGKGTINVKTSELSSGIYRYALLIDGKLADSKQMQQVR